MVLDSLCTQMGKKTLTLHIRNTKDNQKWAADMNKRDKVLLLVENVRNHPQDFKAEDVTLSDTKGNGHKSQDTRHTEKGNMENWEIRSHNLMRMASRTDSRSNRKGNTIVMETKSGNTPCIFIPQ